MSITSRDPVSMSGVKIMRLTEMMQTVFAYDRPSLFIAPALEPDPLKRSLRVLEWTSYALKAGYYAGQDPNSSVRKPLNPVLGEIFQGEWTDETGTTKLITEQVSHHPPITASYLSNEEHGVRGYGYARVEMTFAGSLKIRQTGHLLLHLEKYNEYHLIPLPTAKIKGFLSRKLYPEIMGTYHISSSNGFISEMSFSGEGYFTGTRHSFNAKIYRASDKTKTPLYTLTGRWDKDFTIRCKDDAADSKSSAPAYHQVDDPAPSPLKIAELDEQDPWETRRAWREVLDALHRNNYADVVREKTKLEDAQRAMRRKDVEEGRTWEQKFFSSRTDDKIAAELAAMVGTKLEAEKTKGIWRFDAAKASRAKKPYRGEDTPFGYK